MSEKKLCANVEIPLQALEKSGCVGVDERTCTLILAALTINGMRGFKTEMTITLPLTEKDAYVTADIRIEPHKFEVREGEFIPEEVRHG